MTLATRRVVLSWIAAVAILGITLVSGPSSATPRFTLTVNRTQLVAGQLLRVTATSNVACDLAIRWAGQTRLKRNTKVTVARFIAPRVRKATRYRLVAICHYYRTKPEGSARPRTPVQTTGRGAGLLVEVVVPPHGFKTIIITVDPPGTTSKPSQHPLLPETGGPAGWLVVVAFGFLFTGTAVIRLARERLAPNYGGQKLRRRTRKP